MQLRIQKQKEYYEVARDEIQELSCEVGEKTELITSNQKFDTWRIKCSKLEQEIQSKDDFIRTQSKAISDYCKALNEREKIIQDLRNELELKDTIIANIESQASMSWWQRLFHW